MSERSCIGDIWYIGCETVYIGSHGWWIETRWIEWICIGNGAIVVSRSLWSDVIQRFSHGEG